ncbi:unnamed protein product [Closterium sp. Naga37s-1]|nr:unnamed protein product [Closterium sp. Naga37s-1]
MPAGSLVPTISLPFLSVLPLLRAATGADQAAATAVVPAKVRVGAVVLVGSLVPTFSLRFLSVFALLRLTCSQRRQQPKKWCPRSVSKINASVKSIRVEFLIYSKAPPTCPSPPPVRYHQDNTTKISPSVKSIRCVLDNICSRVKCPAHSTCIKTKDDQECPAHSTCIKTKDDQEVTFESTQS